MIGINKLSTLMPNLFFWKKDLTSRYIEADARILNMLGLNKLSFYGLTDYEVKSFCKIADLFVKEDQLVMNNIEKSPSQFLTITKYPEDKWVIALITKAALRDSENKLVGTFGYGQDLTNFYAKNLINKTALSESSYFIWNNLSIPNEDIKLTPRQVECLFLLLNGMSSKKIARILKLSVRTIEEFIEQLRQKFSCQTKCELIEKAIRRGYRNFIPVKFLNYFTNLLED